MLWSRWSSEKWEFVAAGAIISTPLVHNDTIFIGSFDRHLYAVDAATGKQVWQFPAGDGEDKSDNWFWAEPVVYDNIVYAGCLDNKVYALHADTGAKVAEYDLGSPVSSAPVVIGSSIIFASSRLFKAP